jgi:hypothetical protein
VVLTVHALAFVLFFALSAVFLLVFLVASATLSTALSIPSLSPDLGGEVARPLRGCVPPHILDAFYPMGSARMQGHLLRTTPVLWGLGLGLILWPGHWLC